MCEYTGHIELVILGDFVLELCDSQAAHMDYIHFVFHYNKDGTFPGARGNSETVHFEFSGSFSLCIQ